MSMLETRAGTPPSAVALLRRHQLIGWLEDTGPLFSDWEKWFADIEETHTSQGTLVFFRSPLPERSWITAAGAVLDAAALNLAVVDVPWEPRAALCLRAGFLSLRRIADFFRIPYDPTPPPTTRSAWLVTSSTRRAASSKTQGFRSRPIANRRGATSAAAGQLRRGPGEPGRPHHGPVCALVVGSLDPLPNAHSPHEPPCAQVRRAVPTAC